MGDEIFQDEEFRLGEKSWDALGVAASEIAEMLLADVDEMRSGTPVALTNLSGLMPRLFLHKRYGRIHTWRASIGSQH